MKRLRLSHFHAVLDEGDPFANEGVSLADLAGVHSFAGVVVDGLGTGGAEVGVVHGEVVHLGVELVEAVES